MRHLELFAGIGGFRRAMDILTNDHIMEFHCIGYSEIDSKAEATYRSNYCLLYTSDAADEEDCDG